MISRKTLNTVLTLSVLSLATNSVYAKTDSETETAYEGAPSGIDPTSAKNMITSDGPAMTVEDFNHSKKIFFERCAGCHGVLRKGATGKALTTDITRSRGDAAFEKDLFTMVEIFDGHFRTVRGDHVFCACRINATGRAFIGGLRL